MGNRITDEDLNNRFCYHKPPENLPIVGSTHEHIRHKLLCVAEEIRDSTPECREQSLSITKLEEAMMWANAAVARNHEHYGPEKA